MAVSILMRRAVTVCIFGKVFLILLVVAVCGHSHCAYIAWQEGILLFNPGSITQPRAGRYPSYAIVVVETGQIREADVMQIKEDDSILMHPISGRSTKD